MHALDHFPADYRSARENFLSACAAAGIGTTSRLNPDATGRDGKPLFLDTAVIGPRDARSALLMISATHGVEGYFGSAAQTGMLREGLLEPADGGKIVLLHALNPFGFAWDRRVNEDNADINRNFVDHARPPVNEAYASLAEWIAPKDLSRATIEAANAKLKAYAQTHGEFALQEAISKGQYAFADGIYYGGARESWSSKMLREVIGQELAGVRRLIVIDFHTGLGPHGYGEMISEDLPGSPAYARAKAMWGDRVRSSEAGESVSAPLTGTVDQAFARWLGEVELTFAALEAGTVSTRETFRALRRDNWLYSVARGDDPGAEDIRREIRAAFYPDDDSWKKAVWVQAVEVTRAALGALQTKEMA